MDKGLGCEKYILGGENISYHIFFTAIKNYAYKRIRLIPIPKLLFKIFGFLVMIFCRLTGKETHLSPRVIDRMSQNRALTCDKAIRQLGYSITPFAEGIQKTILHLQNKNHA